MIDVALATRNRSSYRNALQQLNEQTIAKRVSLYILDGNDDDQVSEFVASRRWNFEKITILRDQDCIPQDRRYWSVMYNHLFRQGTNPYITYWSDDLDTDPVNALEKGLEKFTSSEIGATSFAFAINHQAPFKVPEIEGGRAIYCGIIRRDIFENLGGFEEKFKFWFADNDFSLRLQQAGYQIAAVPEAKIRNNRENLWTNPMIADSADEKLFHSRWSGSKPAKAVEYSSLRKISKPRLSKEDLTWLGVTGINSGSYTRLFESALNVDKISLGGKHPKGYDTYTVENEFYIIEEKWLYISADATRKLPVEDGVFEWGFAEHFIEHIEPSAAINWLNEQYRIMIPGAILRISTPDLSKYARAYVQNDQAFFQSLNNYLHIHGFSSDESPVQLINRCFREWGHQFIYDQNELISLIKQSNFNSGTVKVRQPGESSTNHLGTLDDPNRYKESLYVEVQR